jgi:hypothetical protein
MPPCMPGSRKASTLLGPGVVMADMYAAVRAEVEKSPIFPNYARGHVGHSISCLSVSSRIILLISHAVLMSEFQPGMCVSLETSYMAAQGAYAPGGRTTLRTPLRLPKMDTIGSPLCQRYIWSGITMKAPPLL